MFPFHNNEVILRKVWLTRGWVMHKCISKLTIIGSDNGLSPGRRQAIIWTNVGLLSTGHLDTNFREILIEIYIFLFRKMHLKMSSRNLWPCCVRLNSLVPVKNGSNSNSIQLNSLYRIAAWALAVTLLSLECHLSSPRKSQHWFR